LEPETEHSLSRLEIQMNSIDKTIKVWDPLIRAGHWTLVTAFFTAYFTEDEFLTAHVWAGYIIGVVVCFRLLWGIIGSEHARFSDFIRPLSSTFRYLTDLVRGQSKRYLGHNPAGAAMILILLIFLAATVFSGTVLYGMEERAGPLAAWVAENSAREEIWEDLHEVFANLTLLLVVLHVVGVLFSSRAHRENLVKAMINGRKRVSGD
jgi:cytochrome b